MQNNIKKILYRILYPILYLYWNIFKPKTFGVKGVITRYKNNKREILLIKNSYGFKRNLWNIPGGGYNPEKEKPDSAVKREVGEELNLNISDWKKIGEYKSDTEGKRDTVKIFHSKIKDNKNISLSNEINKAKWFSLKEIKSNDIEINKITKHAINII